MMCSARSLSSASSSRASSASSSGFAPRRRVPGDRQRLHPPAVAAHQALGTRRHQRDRAEIEVAQVGAGVDRPQRPVDRERVHAEVGRQALAGNHLEDVARVDVVDRAGHRRHVLLAGEVGAEFHPLPGPVPGDPRQRTAEPLVGLVDQPPGPLVVGPASFHHRRGDDEQPPLEVIEDDQHLGLDEQQIGAPSARRGFRPGSRLVAADQVVGSVADGTSPEVGQLGWPLRLAPRSSPTAPSTGRPTRTVRCRRPFRRRPRRRGLRAAAGCRCR